MLETQAYLCGRVRVEAVAAGYKAAKRLDSAVLMMLRPSGRRSVKVLQSEIRQIMDG